MRLIAHRGFAGEHPENTLAAVRLAADRADAVEVDARRCASGEVVVVHDERVDRVTDGDGRVAELTRDRLAALSVLETDGGVPTLAEVADTLPAGTGLVVELKETGIATDAVAAATGVDELVVSSFLPGALLECRAASPEVPLALVVGGSGGIERASELGCSALHPRFDLCTPEFVRRAHGAGLSVVAWTVRDRETARSLEAAGVDGVIADRPDVLG